MSSTSQILVVDDDIHLLDLITQVLQLHGLSCETVEDGHKALEFIQKKFYDLIISDIRMPGMSGTELLQSIKNFQHCQNKKSKMILMTAYTTEEIMEHADELGVSAFISKPFDIMNLVEQVNDVLLKNE